MNTHLEIDRENLTSFGFNIGKLITLLILNLGLKGISVFSHLGTILGISLPFSAKEITPSDRSGTLLFPLNLQELA